MDDANRGGGSAEQMGTTPGLEQAWLELKAGLACQLVEMTEDGDHLLIEMPDGSGPGCTPYAQFAAFGEGAMIRAELSGNAYLAPMHRLDESWCDTLQMMGWCGNEDDEGNWFVMRPITDAGIIAAMVVGALREAFGVEHPQLLTYNVFGPNADSAEQLGLSATEDVLVELPAVSEPASEVPLVMVPAGKDELAAMVQMTLHAHFGDMPTIDGDGDVVITHLDQPVWVRARDDQPAVEIMARVTHGVHSRRATAAEIAVLNRDHVWTTWILNDRDVWLRLPIPAHPFVAGHLIAMLDVFLTAMSQTRDDLAFRVGGRVA